jgi:hypothetical protein
MPFYDLVCKNNHEQLDVLLPLGERPPCPTCGEQTETLWKKFGNVVPDEIPGGVWINHGICNEDGTPRKYYSKSEMAREAKARGLANIVMHTPVPGTDKSPVTTRWVSVPLYVMSPEAEAERVKRWHDTEPNRPVTDLQEEASKADVH